MQARNFEFKTLFFLLKHSRIDLEAQKNLTKGCCRYINFAGNTFFRLKTFFFRGVSTADAGYYECQVSTEQKMSRLVHLTVMGKTKK